MNRVWDFFFGKKKQAQGDLILQITGAWGSYQLILFLLILYSKFFTCFHPMAIIFLAPKIEYTCGEEGGQTCPCPNPVYDKSVWTRTIIMEWELICDKRVLVSFTQMMTQFGVLVGSVVFGMSADRWGRKKPLLVSVVIQLVGGISAAYVKNFYVFTVLRFFVGASVGGFMVTTFVIIMEFVGAQHREVLSALYQVPFNIGHMLLPVISYYLRDYSDFQLAISAPVALCLCYFCLLPDTPRWLIAVNRTNSAIKILEHVATVNKRPTANIRADVEAFYASLTTGQLKKGTLADIFRWPNMRKNLLVMALNWLACSYCFYGVSQYIGQLTGNAFKNVAISATVTFMGTLVSIPLMKLMGRKTILIVFNTLCGICLLCLSVCPEGIISVLLATVGTVCSFIVFVVVYLYCSELFPTVVRNAAMGFCSMTARIGSMIAPFVIDLRPIAIWMPPVVFASLPLLAGLLTFLLPETKGCPLLTTLEEGEAFAKRRTRRARTT